LKQDLKALKKDGLVVAQEMDERNEALEMGLAGANGQVHILKKELAAMQDALTVSVNKVVELEGELEKARNDAMMLYPPGSHAEPEDDPIEPV